DRTRLIFPNDGRTRRWSPAELLEDVLNSLDQSGAVLYEGVAATILARQDVSGDRQHVPALLERRPRCNERPALFRRLHDDHGPAEAADNAVPQREISGFRPSTRRKLRDD